MSYFRHSFISLLAAVLCHWTRESRCSKQRFWCVQIHRQQHPCSSLADDPMPHHIKTCANSHGSAPPGMLLIGSVDLLPCGGMHADLESHRSVEYNTILFIHARVLRSCLAGLTCLHVFRCNARHGDWVVFLWISTAHLFPSLFSGQPAHCSCHGLAKRIAAVHYMCGLGGFYVYAVFSYECCSKSNVSSVAVWRFLFFWLLRLCNTFCIIQIRNCCTSGFWKVSTFDAEPDFEDFSSRCKQF